MNPLEWHLVRAVGVANAVEIMVNFGRRLAGDVAAGVVWWHHSSEAAGKSTFFAAAGALRVDAAYAERVLGGPVSYCDEVDRVPEPTLGALARRGGWHVLSNSPPDARTRGAVAGYRLRVVKWKPLARAEWELLARAGAPPPLSAADAPAFWRRCRQLDDARRNTRPPSVVTEADLVDLIARQVARYSEVQEPTALSCAKDAAAEVLGRGPGFAVARADGLWYADSGWSEDPKAAKKYVRQRDAEAAAAFLSVGSRVVLMVAPHPDEAGPVTLAAGNE